MYKLQHHRNLILKPKKIKLASLHQFKGRAIYFQILNLLRLFFFTSDYKNSSGKLQKEGKGTY